MLLPLTGKRALLDCRIIRSLCLSVFFYLLSHGTFFWHLQYLYTFSAMSDIADTFPPRRFLSVTDTGGQSIFLQITLQDYFEFRRYIHGFFLTHISNY